MGPSKEKKRLPPMKCWVFERPYHFYIKPYAKECPFEYVYREMGKRASKVSPRELILHLNEYEVLLKVDRVEQGDIHNCNILFKIQNKTLRKATRYKRITKAQLYKTVRRVCSWFYNKAWR